MKKNLVLVVLSIVACTLFFSCAKSPREIIQAEVSAANRSCPQPIVGGLTLTKIDFDGNYVVYSCEGTDEMYFSQDFVTPEIKEQLLQTLQARVQSDASAEKFIEALKEENVGIIYHYYNSLDMMMDVTIEASDL